MNMPLLLWSLLFSSIGLGFFIYGKKQKAVVPLLSGLGLMIYPYFVSNTLLLLDCPVFSRHPGPMIGLPRVQ